MPTAPAAVAVDFYASERQYVDHLAPIWLALPLEWRGTFWTPGKATMLRAWDLGVPAVSRSPRGAGPIVVAGFGDERRVRPRQVALVEHGAGQHYGGRGERHPSSPGGTDRHYVGLFICPNGEVADRNSVVYPLARTAVVGCPKLDRWLRPSKVEDRRSQLPPTLALSFHWRSPLVPEAQSALDHYRSALRSLVQDWPGQVIGHAHPRLWAEASHLYERSGVEPVEQFDQVLERADVYAVDNSSTLYEAAAAGIPVVALNAPWFRREVEHGLRFWSLIPGPQVDGPDELVAQAQVAMVDSSWARERERVAAAVYAVRDGSSSRLAAAALIEWAPTTLGARTVAPKAHNPFQPKRKGTNADGSRASRQSPLEQALGVMRAAGVPQEGLDAMAWFYERASDDERRMLDEQAPTLTVADVREGIADGSLDELLSIWEEAKQAGVLEPSEALLGTPSPADLTASGEGSLSVAADAVEGAVAPGAASDPSTALDPQQASSGDQATQSEQSVDSLESDLESALAVELEPDELEGDVTPSEDDVPSGAAELLAWLELEPDSEDRLMVAAIVELRRAPSQRRASVLAAVDEVLPAAQAALDAERSGG